LTFTILVIVTLVTNLMTLPVLNLISRLQQRALAAVPQEGLPEAG